MYRLESAVCVNTRSFAPVTILERPESVQLEVMVARLRLQAQMGYTTGCNQALRADGASVSKLVRLGIYITSKLTARIGENSSNRLDTAAAAVFCTTRSSSGLSKLLNGSAAFESARLVLSTLTLRPSPRMQ